MATGTWEGALQGASHGMMVSSAIARMYLACFTGETRLYARGAWGEGWRRIDAIATSDEVLSRDEHDVTGPLAWKRVEETFARTAAILVVRVNGHIIRTTAEHPFFVANAGWTPAGKLTAGDLLATMDGDWVAVDAVEDTGDWAAVYNLRVADWHTYFVGCQEWGFSVWAHNYGEDLAYPRNRGPVDAVYPDGTRVYQNQKPSRLPLTPHPEAEGPHSVLRWDNTPRQGDMMVRPAQRQSPRIYQAREFDANGHPVRDIDFTTPTTPTGVPYPGHPQPHQHQWIPNQPGNPAAGWTRGGAEPLGG